MAVAARRIAFLADAVTALRALVTAPLIWFAATKRFDVAAGLLTLAWWSDLVDGRLARRSGWPTRLGPWDLAIDTLVGAALFAGLVGAGVIAFLPWGPAGVALLLGFLRWRNASFGMLVQALAYAVFLAKVWNGEPEWMLVLTASIGGILIADFRRFTTFVLPTFFAGIRGRPLPERTLRPSRPSG